MSSDDMTIKSLQRIHAMRTMRDAVNALRDVLDDDDALDFLSYTDHQSLITAIDALGTARGNVGFELRAAGRHPRS